MFNVQCSMFTVFLLGEKELVGDEGFEPPTYCV